ncbi:MAG: TlyA family RNA methyltransferase [Pseudomonadota bacterium]|nr:TlyA family RNA methyltransferase [Pseudomonadota bacterium]
MTRADVLAVQRGLAPTRSAAQRLIATGAVRWLSPAGWAVPHKAGEDLPDGCRVEVTDDAELRFVSRGGLKLDGALARLGIDVAGMTCLDVGQSTGGFTDVLLSRGAKHVVGVDVGHGQLHPRLAADSRVSALEGVNARHLEASQLPFARFDLVVGDLSFISLALVLPALVPLLAGRLLLLVKPQFELQPVDIGTSGKVRHASAYGHVEKKLRKSCAANGLEVLDWFDSVTPGSEGAREFFLDAVLAGHRDLAP